jgi:catechol 2,3-dioxygenase-like lactoylglutathione lyase family enzyme
MLMKPRYVIAVPDLAVSAAWYRDVLGFKIVEIGDPGWRFYVSGDVTIMAGECRDATPPADLGDHSYFAYIESGDVSSLHAAVKAKGGDITKPLRDEPWGMREFGLRTADGHRIMFGEDLG